MPRFTSYTLRQKQRRRRLTIVLTVALAAIIALSVSLACQPQGRQRLQALARPLYPEAPPQATVASPTTSPTPDALIKSPGSSPTATSTPAVTEVATLPATPSPTATPTLSPSPEATESAPTASTPEAAENESTPTPLPTEETPAASSQPKEIQPGRVWPSPDPASAQDHYWLERPIGPGGQVYANAWYPYGTDAQGQYLPHHGADIVNELGTPVLAVAEAEVIEAGQDVDRVVGLQPNFYGNYIVLRLFRPYKGQPVFVLYGHLSEILVQPGETVQPGQVIGKVGMSGVALGPHLHVEVRIGQNDYAHTRNPELWLKPGPGFGTIAGRLINPEGRTWPDVPILIYQMPNADRIWQQIYTYLDLPDINPDDDWGENFMLADVPAGAYLLETKINGRLYQTPIEIQEGKTSFVIIQTDE